MQVGNENTKFESLRVLVVDDEPTIIKMVATVLRNMGITQIRAATDGTEAMAMLDNAELAFNMVICDWMMPKTSGIQVLRQVRTIDTAIPFLMLTSNVSKEAIIEARSAGVSAYIAKPFTADELARKVTALAKQSLGVEPGMAWGSAQR